MNIDSLRSIINDCELDEEKICVNSMKLHDVVLFIYKNFSYKMLKSITAVDLGDDIELIYDLFSPEDNESVLLSVKVQYEAESIVDIYGSASADENEIYDMFGINFIGNEDLKRLYMPENWEGYPLKKDYIMDDKRLVWNDNIDNA